VKTYSDATDGFVCSRVKMLLVDNGGERGLPLRPDGTPTRCPWRCKRNVPDCLCGCGRQWPHVEGEVS
jgi:hypothetical protein